MKYKTRIWDIWPLWRGDKWSVELFNSSMQLLHTNIYCITLWFTNGDTWIVMSPAMMGCLDLRFLKISSLQLLGMNTDWPCRRQIQPLCKNGRIRLLQWCNFYAKNLFIFRFSAKFSLALYFKFKGRRVKKVYTITPWVPRLRTLPCKKLW